MPSPAQPPSSAARGFFWLRIAVTTLVLALIASRWDSRTGFTALIRFGEALEASRLPAVAALPITTVPGSGYDGQFYAQLAVDPRVLRPEVRAALDLPAYRAQRILLPLLAHLAVDPWWILQVYALLNVAAWLLFAHLWWRETTALAPERAVWLWLAGVLSLGALDSLRFALVDLPATVLLLLGLRAVRTGRGARGVAAFAAAGLVRETVLLAAPVLDDASFWKRWLWRGACAVPALAWFVTLRVLLPPEGSGGFTGNFDWPGQAFVTHIVRCAWMVVHGDLDSRHVWGLIGAVGFAFQAIYVFLQARRQWSSPWVRAGVPFAVLLWVLGGFVWQGYWAVARACLPLSLAFNLTLPAGRGFWWRFALGNACALHAVYRLIPPF